MKRYGWLVNNASMKSEKFIELNNWYKESANKKGIELELVQNDEIYSILESKIRVESKYKEPEFILFMDKDIVLAKSLELKGYKVFNSSKAIEICDNKILTYQILAHRGIRIPKTIVEPFKFYEVEEIKEELIKKIEDELGYPLVIKEAYGSFGYQVYLVNNREELLEKRRELGIKPFLYQEFIEISKGKDVRIHVVGNRVVTAMMRESKTDFRANVTNGGKMKKVEISEAFKKVAIEASKVVEADFSGVDLLFSEDENNPIVCEVNSNAHIKNIYNCTGVNVADYIFDYIMEKL